MILLMVVMMGFPAIVIGPQFWSFEGRFISDFVTKVHFMGTEAKLRPGSSVEIECQFVDLNGYVKEMCMINGKVFYKCPFSEHFYKERLLVCGTQSFSDICRDDTSFYQSCGHAGCPGSAKLHSAIPNSDIGVCGDIICYYRGSKWTDPHIANILGTDYSSRCDGRQQCLNTIDSISVDEYGCSNSRLSFDCDNCAGGRGPNMIKSAFVCDAVCHCHNCYDEANCYNVTKGIFCTVNNKVQPYQICKPKANSFWVAPQDVCNGRKDCLNGEDERTCDMTNICVSRHSVGGVRRLHPTKKCSFILRSKMCDNHQDQMNCTQSNRELSPLTCNINGYATTLSTFVVCMNLKLCDDNLDSVCFETKHCRVHKHRICDGVLDCTGGWDEAKHFCSSMTRDNITCERKLSVTGQELPIPSSWILDGIEDCRNGIDEARERWFPVCGKGDKREYSYETQFSCEDEKQFKCTGSSGGRALKMDELCKDLSNCDKVTCLTSRRGYTISFQVTSSSGNEERLFYCLPGMDTLQNVLGECRRIRVHDGYSVYGVPDKYALLSERYAMHVDCRDTFGEFYVYLVCSGQCADMDIACPVIKPLQLSSCINQVSSRPILVSITNSKKLTLVRQSSKGRFAQDMYGCKNGRCLEYHQVCNLVDDCGDDSDERDCENSVKCRKSGEYVPFSKVCDGVFDCFDFSDECNEECDNQVKIFEHSVIFVVACTIGCVVLVLNICVLIEGMFKYLKIRTKVGQLNQSLILVICSGDLLQGMFLVLVVVSDRYLNQSSCETQIQWITNKMCTVLGVLSTVGSLVSLYSMTILSVVRACGTTRMVPPAAAGDVSVKSRVFQVLCILTIYHVAVLVAVFPLIPPIDEHFVLRKSYDENPLLVGKLDKSQHIMIALQYYGRFNIKDCRWKVLDGLVNGMFTHGQAWGSSIGFYESNGLCLFNYFSRGHNPHTYNSIFVMATNLLCIIVITLCYAVVFLAARRSSVLAGTRNKHVNQRNQKIQRKVSLIILTDILTWLPFLLICCSHLIGVFDASNWYSIFSIIVLPLNSIMNPICILEKYISVSLVRKIRRARGMFHTSRNNAVSVMELTERPQGATKPEPSFMESIVA